MNIFSTFNPKSMSMIWLMFFFYAIAISLAIQFLILPYILPQYHDGNGILSGVDSYLYHTRAEKQFNLIMDFGWSAWELRPEGWGITGVISAFYAFFGVAKPFIMIPIYAALHSLGSLCIVLLIEKLGVSRKVAFFSALPYLIFPSSVLWVTQLLKDVFTLNATLFVLYGLIEVFELLKNNSVIKSIKIFCFSIFIVFTGLLLIWIIRPYMHFIIIPLILLVLVTLNVILLKRVILRKVNSINILFLLLFQLIIALIFYGFPNTTTPSFKQQVGHSIIQDIDQKNLKLTSSNQSYVDEKLIKKANETKNLKLTSSNQSYVDEKLIKKANETKNLKIQSLIRLRNQIYNVNTREALTRLVGKFPDEFTVEEMITISIESIRVEIEILEKTNIVNELLKENNVIQKQLLREFKPWAKSSFLPDKIDSELSKIYYNRSYFHQTNPDGNSSVDVDQDINSFSAMLNYLPRASQVAFLAPFPNTWLDNYSSKISNLMHKINGMEMLLIYFFLVGAFLSVFIWNKKIELWIMLSFSVYYCLFFTYAFPNVGTLIRYRYAGLMLLVAIGIAAIVTLYVKTKNKEKLKIF